MMFGYVLTDGFPLKVRARRQSKQSNADSVTGPLYMKSLFFLAASLFAGINANEDVDAGKLDAGCRLPYDRCPADIATQAIPLLTYTWFQAINNKELGYIQVNKSKLATIRTNYVVPDVGCVNSGEIDLLNGLIPILPTISMDPAAQLITSSYIDAKGRLIVFTQGEQTMNSIVYTIQGRLVFEPVPGTSCAYQIAEYSMTDIAC